MGGSVFLSSLGLCGNFWFICVTSMLLHHLMGSWHPLWLFHTPVRAGSCCGMKSLLILLSDLFSLSHTHVHTSTQLIRSPYVLSAVCLSSHVLHGAFPSLRPHPASPEPIHLLLLAGLGAQTLMGAVPWLPAVRRGWWQGQVLAGAPLCREGAGGYQRAQDLLPLVNDAAFPSAKAKSTHAGLTQQII